MTALPATGFLNATKQAHFISQTEQRLNALNPSARPERQRIYQFVVSDRDKPVLTLKGLRGMRISRSLSRRDLFSFDIVDSVNRRNLEATFQRYEQDTAKHSNALLSKLRSPARDQVDVKPEVINLFAAKLLNFVRNPHSVRKVLNTISLAARFHPTDPDLSAEYARVLNGNRPHRASVAKAFGLTPELYDCWIRVLFIVLARAPGADFNVFDGVIKELFESSYFVVQVFDYLGSTDDAVCLLSDRGFNERLAKDEMFSWEFNVCSRAFARFTFCSPIKMAPPGIPDTLASKLQATGTVTYHRHDHEELCRYNQLAAYQSAGFVYAAHASPRL